MRCDVDVVCCVAFLCVKCFLFVVGCFGLIVLCGFDIAFLMSCAYSFLVVDLCLCRCVVFFVGGRCCRFLFCVCALCVCFLFCVMLLFVLCVLLVFLVVLYYCVFCLCAFVCVCFCCCFCLLLLL